MGIASLIIGIIVLCIALVPVFGVPALLPALVGLGLGIAHIATASHRRQPKGAGIAGVVLNGVAIVVIVGWLMLIFYFGQRTFEGFVQQHGVSFGTPTQTAPAPLPADPKFKPMTPVDEPADSDSAL